MKKRKIEKERFQKAHEFLKKYMEQVAVPLFLAKCESKDKLSKLYKKAG